MDKSLWEYFEVNLNKQCEYTGTKSMSNKNKLNLQ